MSFYKIDRRKDGKQGYRVFVSFTNTDGKRITKTKCVYGLQEAKETERDLSEDIKTASSSITVEQLYKEYVKSKRHEVRNSSLAKSESVLLNHVLNTDLAKRRLDKLSKKHLQDWKNVIAEKKIKTSTKNGAYKELNTLLNYAVSHDYLIKNPLREIGRFRDPYFKADEEKVKYYTIEEFNRYIKAAKDSIETQLDYACYVFFYILFYSGLRKGELNALLWSDFDGDTLNITKSLAQKVGYEITPPKNKPSYRRVKLPPKAIKVLDDYRVFLKKNSRYREDMWLCGGFKPIPDSTIENRNKYFAKVAGLPHRCIHDFRHSHATLLINKGVNIVAVSRRLGHSDVKMTLNTYAHLYPTSDDEVVNALETAGKSVKKL